MMSCINKVLSLCLAVLLALGPARVAGQTGGAAVVPGQLVKAAFMYKFLSFMELPDSAFVADSSAIKIGILCTNTFGEAFASVVGTTVDNRKLEVVYLPHDALLTDLVACQLLFIASSMDTIIPTIVKRLEKFPVLTVSDTEQFVEAGGMVEFFEAEDQIRFNINNSAAKNAGIKLRSRLLRVAAAVYDPAYKN